MPVEFGPGGDKDEKRGSLVGDDRHGQSPRPGGRAPWERYPTADNTERDGAHTSRRSRHDAPDDSGSTPLTVQDLVEKVDNERTGRRRRAQEPAAQARNPRRPDTPPQADPGQRPVDPAARAPESARPPRPASGTRAPAHPGAAPPRSGGNSRPSTGSVVVDDIAGKNPPAPPRGAGKRAPKAEPAEAVTDVIEPVTDSPVAEPKRARKATPSPATRASAEPKPVGKPPLSRLAAGKQRRNRRLKTAGRVSATLFAVLALLITGGGWSYLRATNNSFTQVSALDDNSEDIVDSNAQLGDENFLIVGTDTRAGANGRIGAGTIDDAEGARADTAMLVHIPKNRKRVVVVSFPRDLDVTRPQCAGWDNDKPGYTEQTFPSAIGDKLNAVYALGGPKCLVSTIQRLTGSTINHFIGIDFAGFEAMVDQVGGVEVCAPKPIVDEILGTVLEKSGKQRIDGATALSYVRARHVYGEERSDYDRINRQQRFLASLLRGALSSRVLFDPGKLNGFIRAFTEATFVDKVAPDDLLMLGRSLQKMDAGTVTFLTIPTAGTTSYGNEIPRESDIKAIFKAIRDDQPLPGEKHAATDATTTTTTPAAEPPKMVAVDPNNLSLLVSNGSGVPGAANTAANKLTNFGFNLYSTGNYSLGNSATTKVRYAPGHEAEAATVASSVPGSTLESDSELGSIIEVVIGKDYTGVIKAPTPVGDIISNVATAPSAPAALPPDLEHINAADDTCV
ncbi:LCP family protein [Nocardia sp. NPDC005366]|uniref:LCP family protein n=1 Tax=Nocardia sp. NPDC005366 TaxID=3156878 RepID=UPI0033B70DB1